jgi:hypothetical protein
MGGTTFHEASIAILINGTTSLLAILKKASEHPESATFPSARLIDDMWPLTNQVHYALAMAGKAVRYVCGLEVKLVEREDVQTIAEMIAQCEKTLDLLKSVDPKTIEGTEDEMINPLIRVDPPLYLAMTKREMISGYTLPNFFFHVNTAYAILRMKGVPIGKMDYVTPFMTAINARRNAS